MIAQSTQRRDFTQITGLFKTSQNSQIAVLKKSSQNSQKNFSICFQILKLRIQKNARKSLPGDKKVMFSAEKAMAKAPKSKHVPWFLNR